MPQADAPPFPLPKPESTPRSLFTYRAIYTILMEYRLKDSAGRKQALKDQARQVRLSAVKVLELMVLLTVVGVPVAVHGLLKWPANEDEGDGTNDSGG